jgi:hypothetical protein
VWLQWLYWHSELYQHSPVYIVKNCKASIADLINNITLTTTTMVKYVSDPKPSTLPKHESGPLWISRIAVQHSLSAWILRVADQEVSRPSVTLLVSFAIYTPSTGTITHIKCSLVAWLLIATCPHLPFSASIFAWDFIISRTFALPSIYFLEYALYISASVALNRPNPIPISHAIFHIFLDLQCGEYGRLNLGQYTRIRCG